MQSAGGDEASAVDKLVGEIATAIVSHPSTLLVFSGAGTEPDLDDLNPNSVHALCALICSRGGAHVTANFSGLQLLAQPHDQGLEDIAFVAVHGTIYDQLEGRGHMARRRRPRCTSASKVPLLRGRSITVPIPMQDVKDSDPNVQDARDAAAGGRATLLVIGSSVLKATNGRSLHFLDAAKDCRRVVFINPDRSRTARLVGDDLRGWGLPPQLGQSVECAHVDAQTFARCVLDHEAVAAAGLREQCLRWVDPSKVRLMRQRFRLPPAAELGAVRDHPFGASRVTVGTIYGHVAQLHAVANGGGAVEAGEGMWEAPQLPPNSRKRAKLDS